MDQASIGLEQLVAKSLRQLPAAEAPLMAWPIVCGSTVSERTRAFEFREGVLKVEVPDAGWKSELQSLAPQYLAAINRYTTETVRRVEFVVSGSVAGSVSRNKGRQR